jgi:hypothetical protein
MIRRDYILRMVQEMVQMLARVMFLKSRREYDQALSEINQALRQLGAEVGGQASLSVEDWIALCRKHEPSAAGLMMATADLLREQGEVLTLQEKPAEGHCSRVASLTLFLEAILTGETFISAELLAKVETLIDLTRGAARPTALWLRIVRYLETRGLYGLAEDEVFAWAETGNETARKEGLAFYERLLATSDDALQHGGLPRDEVLQGREEFCRRFKD